jgi:subtilase family serine protease
MTVASLRPRAIGIVITGGVVAIAGFVTSTPTMAATPRASIAGTLPNWAVTTGDTPAPAVTTGRVDAQIYLAGVDPSGLASYATAVSTPGNSLFGHYLTPAEVQARFGPTSAQIASIEAWVRSAGLTVADVSDHMGGYVTVIGSLAAARRAFDVTFGSFKGPDGNSYRSPEEAASAPSSIASSILTVAGLDTAPHVAKPMLPPPGPNYWIAPPCSKYYG